MEGDGPIMGTPKAAGVVLMGRDLVAVDASAARVMGLRPERVRYLAEAARFLGNVDAARIPMRGEAPRTVRHALRGAARSSPRYAHEPAALPVGGGRRARATGVYGLPGRATGWPPTPTWPAAPGRAGRGCSASTACRPAMPW